jgi:hypothetical protein
MSGTLPHTQLTAALLLNVNLLIVSELVTAHDKNGIAYLAIKHDDDIAHCGVT